MHLKQRRGKERVSVCLKAFITVAGCPCLMLMLWPVCCIGANCPFCWGKKKGKFSFHCLPVLRWCLYWCDCSQVAAPGKQQAKDSTKKPGVWHHHQPHVVQQPMELHLPAGPTAQVRVAGKNIPKTSQKGSCSCFSIIKKSQQDRKKYDSVTPPMSSHFSSA